MMKTTLRQQVWRFRVYHGIKRWPAYARNLSAASLLLPGDVAQVLGREILLTLYICKQKKLQSVLCEFQCFELALV
jgi:hypothetical protein